MMCTYWFTDYNKCTTLGLDIMCEDVCVWEGGVGVKKGMYEDSTSWSILLWA